MDKKLWLGCAALTTGLTALYTVAVTEQLMKTAIDREAPKSYSRQRARLTRANHMNEQMKRRKQAAQVLRDSTCQTVEILSRDGERLIGHWHHEINDRRVILAMHGWRSSWSADFGLISDFWHKSGCSVLYAEQRGQNSSSGKYMGFGMLERHDCLDWIHWINQTLKEKLPIYLGGVSMGASTVLMASGTALPDNVRGIIADCGFTCAEDIWKKVLNKNLHLSYLPRRRIAEKLCQKRIHMGPSDYSTLDAMKTNTLPVLFIHGTDDHFVPIEMTYENYKACTAPKHLFIVPGAEHGMSYLSDTKGYQQALTDFFSAYDRIS